MIVRQNALVTRKTLGTTRSAFTLLEVLVVVAIIVMLAGVGGYYLLARYEDAKVSRAKIDCESLSGQVEIYKLNNNGNYPQSIEQLTQPQPNGSSPLVPPDKIKDPWGKPYQIRANGKNGENKADVFTTTPKGVAVGNFSN